MNPNNDRRAPPASARAARREVYLGDLWGAVRARWLLVLVLAALGALAGLVFALGCGPAYLAPARLQAADGAAARSLRRLLNRPELWDRVMTRAALREDAASLAACWGIWGRLWGRLHAAAGGPVAASRRETADALQARLVVRREGDGCSFAVGILSPEPREAARLANALADQLVESGALETPGPHAPPDVAPGQPAVAALAARRVELQTRTEQLEAFVQNRGAADAVPYVPFIPGDQLLEKLRADLADITQHRRILSARLGQKHPDMLELQRRADTVLEQIDAEASHLLASFRKELDAVLREEHALAAAGEPAPDRTRLVLRTLGRAEPPSAPYRARQARMAGFGALAGFLAGVVTALLKERRRFGRAPSGPRPDTGACEHPELHRKP